MFPAAADGRARAVLLTLGGAEHLAGFYLAGGTAAALHYGHRLSHDLDLFTPEPWSGPRSRARGSPSRATSGR